jgi:putative selenate reductase
MAPVLACVDGRLIVAGAEPFVVEQDRQIVNINDFCNACGDCTIFCVHEGRPWFDKPRLFLNEPDFIAADHNAYRLTGDIMRRRHQGHEARLERRNGSGPKQWIYEDDCVRVTLTPDFRIADMALKQPFEGTISLRDAAEMAVVFDGITGSLPHLVV